jgi:hypothetical protein
MVGLLKRVEHLSFSESLAILCISVCAEAGSLAKR